MEFVSKCILDARYAFALYPGLEGNLVVLHHHEEVFLDKSAVALLVAS